MPIEETMSDNIKRAMAAIQAELAHARQGVAHYEQLVTNLQGALNQLDGVGGGNQSAAPKSKRGRKPKAVPVDVPKPRGRKAKGDLPFTGGDFWESLVTATPAAAKDVLAAAQKKLDISPDRAHVKKLTNRMVFALNSLVKAGAIKDSGRGRDRRFFAR